MKAEKTQKEGVSRAIQTKLGSRGRVYMEDNRHGAIGQAKFINAIQAKSTPRNVIQRANEGEDNDKSKIDVFPLSKDIQISVKKRSKGEIIANLQGDNYDYTGQLKHYMVVRKDKQYQFPVKYLHFPEFDEKMKKWWTNKGKLDEKRGGQPEGFGGNQDEKDGVFDTEKKMCLLGSRDNTLAREYREEARKWGTMEFTIEHSKLFHTQWGDDTESPHDIVGTLSIASSQYKIEQSLFKDVIPSCVSSHGRAEMAGTIVIDCNKLIGNDRLVGDELEKEIGDLIQKRRNDLINDWIKILMKAPSEQKKDLEEEIEALKTTKNSNPFAQEGGILAHLVSLVAEDIMARRPTEMSASSSSSSSTPSVPLPPSSTPSFSSSTPTSSSSSSSPSSGMEERSEDSESVSEKEPGKTKNVSKEESAEEDSKKESQTDDASEEDVDEEEETDAVEEDGAEEESQTDDVSEERPEHSQSRGWFSTIFGAPWRWIKRLFSN